MALLKKLLFSLILIFFGIEVYGQKTLSEDLILDNAHVMEQNAILFIECEGYNIFSQDHNLTFDQKGIDALKKLYDLPADLSAVKDGEIESEHVIFTISKVHDNNLAQHFYYYVIPLSDKSLKVIGFETYLSRNKEIEHLFVKRIIESNIPENIMAEAKIDSFKLGNTFVQNTVNCKWTAPHQLQCNNELWTWAQFRDDKRAREFFKIQQILLADTSQQQISKKGGLKINILEKESEAYQIISAKKKSKRSLGKSEYMQYLIISKNRGLTTVATCQYFSDQLKKENALFYQIVKVEN